MQTVISVRVIPAVRRMLRRRSGGRANAKTQRDPHARDERRTESASEDAARAQWAHAEAERQMARAYFPGIPYAG